MSDLTTSATPAAGVHHGISNADYQAIPALSATGLKRMARSPLHYYATTLDPNRPPFDSTPAMRAGTLAHCVILEPEQVAKRFVMRPAGLDLRTKEGKAWAADVQPGRDVVTEEQMLTAQRQAASIRALPEIASLLASGRAESSAFAVDPETGVLLKCRPDWYSAAGEGHIIVDIKTTQDASPDGFPRSLAKFGYHLQAVHYVDVFERATGVPVLGFVFACVESDWPHAAAAYSEDSANSVTKCLSSFTYSGFISDQSRRLL